MASPMPMASWNMAAQVPQNPQPTHGGDESGIQIISMGLKVHYSFDKTAQDNCLAKLPQNLPVQTTCLDDGSRIGIINVRTAVQAVVSCSPELLNQSDVDYSVYAVDYTEPETPFVGQGILSWIMDPSQAEQPDQVVYGRVTKKLAMFGRGGSDTLEVKLKLVATAKMQRLSQPAAPPQSLQYVPSPQAAAPMQQPGRVTETVMTPTGTAEWSAFMQSNPQLGRVQSPAIPSAPIRPEPVRPLQRRESVVSTRDGIENQPGDERKRIAPTPVDTTDISSAKAPSRPSSRASRKRGPTGRPRGRPRKNPPASEGNISGSEYGTEAEDSQTKMAGLASQKPHDQAEKVKEADTDEDEPLANKRKGAARPVPVARTEEDATEAEDGQPPKKKRVTTTKVSKGNANPFGSASDSLRVAASTSGSLRNFRPIAASEVPAGSHLQEMPRAPTPVPQAPKRVGQPGSRQMMVRKPSAMSQEIEQAVPMLHPSYTDTSLALSPGQDDRSPQKQAVLTPNYPDSPNDIGSSPPVPRSGQFLHSSPMPSSPILPPMPQPDSGFMSGGPDDLFEEDDMDLVKPARQPQTKSKRLEGVPIQVFRLADTTTGTDQELVQISGPPPDMPAPAAQLSHSAPTMAAVAGLHRSTTAPAFSGPSLHQKAVPELFMQPTVTFATPMADHLPRDERNSMGVHFADSEMQGEGADLDQSKSVPNHSELMPAPSSTRPSTAMPRPQQRPLGRSASMGALALPVVPASDPVGPSPLALPTLPHATSFSEALCPPSEAALLMSEAPVPTSPIAAPRSSKNYVKKQSIKQRLLKAIDNGEMPPYCANCGAIETPTWRKIWTQDHQGAPEPVQVSDKQGSITAIDILARDESGVTTAYRLVKKTLGSEDNPKEWTEGLLCNPCGIWLTKRNAQRPKERWEQDQARLGQERRKKGSGPRPRNRKPKSGGSANPRSDAYFATDPAGPADNSPEADASPNDSGDVDESVPGQETQDDETGVEQQLVQLNSQMDDMLQNPFAPKSQPASQPPSQPGSTHSRASRGTAQSPIRLEDDAAPDMGSTRRLLFPSPRKDGVPKVLGEISINLVQTLPGPVSPKEIVGEKENLLATTAREENHLSTLDTDDIDSLFRTPARPSTPPPKEKKNGPFKTPTRPTPNHRPITRSVSRSIRSARSMRSPSQILQRTPSRTPSKTPRSNTLGVPSSMTLRRSPRHHHPHLEDGSIFETPLTASINQMLRETVHFQSDDFMDLDMSGMSGMDGSALIDFGNLLSTDAPMPSSPPGLGRDHGFGYVGASEDLATWAMTNGMEGDADDLESVEE